MEGRPISKRHPFIQILSCSYFLLQKPCQIIGLCSKLRDCFPPPTPPLPIPGKEILDSPLETVLSASLSHSYRVNGPLALSRGIANVTAQNKSNVGNKIIQSRFVPSALTFYFFVKVYYRPQRSWGKVIFSQASVILFTGSLPQCMLGYPIPPGAGTSRDQAWPPQTR